MASPATGSPAKSGSSESGGIKRKMSAAQAGKVAAALEKLRQEEQERAMQRDLDVIINTIKGKHELILATKAFVLAGCSVEPGSKGSFPRGVRTVGETSSKIPQRDAIRLLSCAFKLPPSLVSNIDDLKVNAHRLLCLGLGVGMKCKLPSQVKEEVTEWMESRYISQGRPLSHFVLDAPELKWETGEIGHFFLVQGAEGIASHVCHRRTGEKKALAIQAPIAEWAFECNWHERSCYLQRESMGMVTKCMMTSLFNLDDEEAPWPAPPAHSTASPTEPAAATKPGGNAGMDEQTGEKKQKTNGGAASSPVAETPVVVASADAAEEQVAAAFAPPGEGDGAQD